jgi:hypothetical protein
MMAVTGASRWKKVDLKAAFWDRRPFSRIVVGFKAELNLNDYIAINRFETMGYSREGSRLLVDWNRAARAPT